MTISRVVLLTTEAEGAQLGAILHQHAPDLQVDVAPHLDALSTACLVQSPAPRLIAFCTSFIVPAPVLDAVMHPAYNFHPGPPTYPGSHAASFALYDQATRFGVTVHEMTARVDEGAIVAVDWFDIPNKARVDQLDVLAYRALAGQFHRLAPWLATKAEPLPPLDVQWSGVKHTKAEFNAMKNPPLDASEDEIRLRFRAFG